MGDEKRKSYVDRYIENLESAQDFEETMIVNLTLRIDAYSAELLDALVKKFRTKKVTFLKEPVQDFIMKSAKKAGVVDSKGIIKKEYREAE